MRSERFHRDREAAGALKTRYDASTQKLHLMDGTTTRLFLEHGVHRELLLDQATTLATFTGHAIAIVGADGSELLTVSEDKRDAAQKAGV